MPIGHLLMNAHRSWVLFCMAAVVTCLALSGASAQKTVHFSPLGTEGTRARAISGDGSTVVGGSHIHRPSIAPFKWTLDEGMQALPGDPDTPGTLLVPLVVSYDGSVIEGIRNGSDTTTLAVTPDGTVQVGTYDNGSVSTIWSSDGLRTGFVDLQGHGLFITSDLFAGRESRLTGVVDLPGGGRRYIGWVRLRDSIDGPSEPTPALPESLASLEEDVVSFVFDTSGTGLPALRLLAPGPGLSGPDDRSQLTTTVFDISADGQYGVGRRWFPLVPIGARWDLGTGDLIGPEFVGFAINGISADGSVLTSDVGRVWTEASDWVNMTSLLEVAGLSNEIAGWTDFVILDVSDDGMTFMGLAKNPQGQSEGWVATVPEPGSLLLGLGLAGSFLLRRRSCKAIDVV